MATAGLQWLRLLIKKKGLHMLSVPACAAVPKAMRSGVYDLIEKQFIKRQTEHTTRQTEHTTF